MARLVWGASGTRKYEAGVDRGVLYPSNLSYGVPWNGLTSVKEAPSGGDPQPYYLDGIKYLQVASAEEFNSTIEAFTAPPEFDVCDGTANIYAGVFITQQPRKAFSFSYRTLIGNDLQSDAFGYKLHIIYNCLAKPTSRDNQTLNDSVDAMTLSWDVTTVPPPITGFKPSAHIVIDSTKADPSHLEAVENVLYGSESSESRLLTVQEIMTIFGS